MGCFWGQGERRGGGGLAVLGRNRGGCFESREGRSEFTSFSLALGGLSVGRQEPSRGKFPPRGSRKGFPLLWCTSALLQPFSLRVFLCLQTCHTCETHVHTCTEEEEFCRPDEDGFYDVPSLIFESKEKWWRNRAGQNRTDEP